MARLYARVVGPTVILVGIVGLVLGSRPIDEALNIDLVEDAIHLSTGGLLTVLVSGLDNAIHLALGLLGTGAAVVSVRTEGRLAS